MARFTSILLPALSVPVALLSASAAPASGQLPPMPMESRTFASFALCRAFLDTTYQADVRKADPKPVRRADGTTAQTLVDSKGVTVTDRNHASYEVEEGWQYRLPQPDVQQIRTNYSYDRRSYACDGRQLTGTSMQGYHIEGYEPLPADGKIP